MASIPSFENLLNNQSNNNGIITAPPGFPWRDPLDQIFGITTSSPIQTASVASNQLVLIIILILYIYIHIFF